MLLDSSCDFDVLGSKCHLVAKFFSCTLFCLHFSKKNITTTLKQTFFIIFPFVSINGALSSYTENPV